MKKKYLLFLVPVCFFVVWIFLGNYIVCPTTNTLSLSYVCTQEEAFYASLSYSIFLVLPLMTLFLTDKKYIKVLSIIVILLFLILSFGTLLSGFGKEGNYLLRYFYLGLADTNKFLAWAIYVLPIFGVKISM